MFRPNRIGPKALYLNPSSDIITTADQAAIDTAVDFNSVSPYAYTATVRDDYDAFRFYTGLPGVYSTIAVGMRVAFGLFLSPENEKGNFLFQVYGRAKYIAAGTSPLVNGSFFFGRKATNNTVVSSKAGVNNTLAQFILLPSNSCLVSNTVNMEHSIVDEVFTLNLSGGFVYCFGFLIDNNSSVNTVSLTGSVDLAFRKYTSEISTFQASA